jgi:hypothetical protein
MSMMSSPVFLCPDIIAKTIENKVTPKHIMGKMLRLKAEGKRLPLTERRMAWGIMVSMQITIA